MDTALPFTRDFGMERDEQREWVEEARRGNLAAFERLIRRHERLVLRVAQRILLNREAARDIAQDVFLRFHQNL
ncbi:MAG: hypothetical protein INR62_05135, partial [Rhodospirillales bacterium]|nr:hypothetical protein [Acetobacter sp.]